MQKAKINKPIHCQNCSKILFVLIEAEELELTIRCQDCGRYQVFTAKKSFDYEVKEGTLITGK